MSKLLGLLSEVRWEDNTKQLFQQFMEMANFKMDKSVVKCWDWRVFLTSEKLQADILLLVKFPRKYRLLGYPFCFPY
jgi:hypothetical protein